MKKITKILTLSLSSLMLFACDDILAKPTQVVDEEKLVNIGGKDDYYKNNFDVIYDQLVSSGTSNSTILTALLNNISKIEVAKFYNLSTEEFQKVLDQVKLVLAHKQAETLTGNAKKLEDIILEKVKDQFIEKVKGGSYSTDNLYNEEEFANELKTSLYTVEGDTFVEDYLITPESKFDDLFKADYSDYIERNIYPDLLKELLTSVYLYENAYTSLGRAYGRDVKYIKLDAISTHKDSVPVLVNSYLKAFAEGSKSAGTFIPTDDFDLESLAKIYKGVNTTQKEKDFATNNDVTTREDVLNEELEKVGTYDSSIDDYIIHTDASLRDDDLVSTYTGSYTYTVGHGKTLKERELAALDIVVDDGLVIKSGGVSSLPSDMRDRLFSSAVASNLKTIKNETENKSVQILVPKLTQNISPEDDDYYLNQYAYYDSSSSAYYIIIVDDYYNTTLLKDGKGDNVNEATKDKALEIARLLSSTSSNQKDAIVYYLKQYQPAFGDQKFYDYIKDTYPDVVDED